MNIEPPGRLVSSEVHILINKYRSIWVLLRLIERREYDLQKPRKQALLTVRDDAVSAELLN